MKNILSANYDILNTIATNLSTIAEQHYLHGINPSGTGIFTFTGDIDLSNNLSAANVYCINNNLTTAVTNLDTLTNNLSGATTI